MQITMVGIGFWIGFVTFVLVMLSLDLFVFHKKDTVMKVKTALLWSLFWIGLAVVFNIGVYYFLGHQKALEFLTGYLIEESLSVVSWPRTGSATADFRLRASFHSEAGRMTPSGFTRSRPQ